MQALGTPGRLCLARLCLGQCRLCLTPRVLLGGIEAGPVDGQGDAVGGAFQQLHIRLGEVAWGGAAHADHPHQSAHLVISYLILNQQRHTGDRVQTLSQPGVHCIGVAGGEVIHKQRLTARRDAAADPLPHRNLDATDPIRQHPTRRPDHQRLAILIQQEDTDVVHAHDVGHAVEQLTQQVVERQVREGRVGQGL